MVQLKLYTQDWDYRKNNTDIYPELKSITSQPSSFWFVDNPKKQIKRLSSRIRRLCRSTHPYQPVIVLYSIPDRDVGETLKRWITTITIHRVH